jgi:hypothetical protein
MLRLKGKKNSKPPFFAEYFKTALKTSRDPEAAAE